MSSSSSMTSNRPRSPLIARPPRPWRALLPASRSPPVAGSHTRTVVPRTNLAAHVDAPALRLDGASRQRQAEPDAAAGRLGREERIEDAREKGARDARAAVAHRQLDAPRAVAPPLASMQQHRAAGLGRVERVLDQLTERVADALFADGERRQVVGDDVDEHGSLRARRRRLWRRRRPARSSTAGGMLSIAGGRSAEKPSIARTSIAATPRLALDRRQLLCASPARRAWRRAAPARSRG